MRIQASESKDEAFRIGDEPAAVLLLAPGDVHEEAVCSSLLSTRPPQDTQFLSVTLDGTPDDRLAVWRNRVGELPAEAAVIDVGETTRSASAASASGPGMTPVSIETVGDPADLTGLAIAISKYADTWTDTASTPVVCFHSLTSLLSHVAEERVFQLLHAMTGRLRDSGAVAHYHLDPTACDDSVVNRFSPLFDVIVEVGSDGSVSARHRRVR